MDNYVAKPELEEEDDVLVMVDENHEYKIILLNDDYNTFEHVINCLVKYCKHTAEQAEQCALIVHYKGQCDVKRGSYKKLEPICAALLESGLTAEIL